MGALDVPLDAFIRAEGLVGVEAESAAHAVLVAAGLTRPGKQRMAVDKLARARVLLARTLVPRCVAPLCRQTSTDGRRVVTVAAPACPICGGSNARRALTALAAGLAGSRVQRLLILGGIGEQHRELAAALAGTRIELHCVDGTGAVPVQEARAAVPGADLIVVWASTPLPHKVSLRYTEEARRLGVRQITVARRGVEALVGEVLRAVGQPLT